MNSILDFVKHAFPWVVIGLFVAISAVRCNDARQGKPAGKLMKALSWAPFVCFMLVALMEYMDANTSSATTWLIIGVCSTLINRMQPKSE